MNRTGCFALIIVAAAGCTPHADEGPVAHARAELAAIGRADGAALLALKLTPAETDDWQQRYARLLASGELDAEGFDRALAQLRAVAASGLSPAREADLAALKLALPPLLEQVEAALGTTIDQDPYLNRTQREAAKSVVKSVRATLSARVLLTPEVTQGVAAALVAALDESGIRRFADLSAAEPALLANRLTLLLRALQAAFAAAGIEVDSVLSRAKVRVVERTPERALVATEFSIDGQTLTWISALQLREGRWWPARSGAVSP
jgi:hypothetical protein